MNERLERLRARLEEIPLEALLVTTPENRRYLSGFTGSAGALLISKQAAILATDFRYVEQVSQQAPEFQLLRIQQDVAEHFGDLAAAAEVTQVGFEGANLTFAAYQQISKGARQAGVEFLPTRSLVEDLRAIKESGELDLIRRAADLTDRCFQHVLNIVAVGMTEHELAWEIEKFMRESGADGLAFDTIAASGPNAALPHATPSGRALGTGEPIVIDMGARWAGYCSDFTRTICLGQPDPTFGKVYTTVLQANEAATQQIRTGMTGEQADEIAREVIARAGFGENFGHGLGHGVGLEVHEYPRLGMRSRDELKDGMVVTVEPGIYLPGWGGVRIEDLTVLQDGCVRVLSQATRHPLVTPRS